jgi:hypothetical protein
MAARGRARASLIWVEYATAYAAAALQIGRISGNETICPSPHRPILYSGVRWDLAKIAVNGDFAGDLQYRRDQWGEK